MPIKPQAMPCRIREQIIEDLPSGLTLQFEATPQGGMRMVIAGRVLRSGKREIVFDRSGELSGVSAYDGEWPPSWLSRAV